VKQKLASTDASWVETHLIANIGDGACKGMPCGEEEKQKDKKMSAFHAQLHTKKVCCCCAAGTRAFTVVADVRLSKPSLSSLA